MRRTAINYWIDVTMLILAAVESVSTLLLWVILPQGYFPSRLTWLAIHKWVGLALGLGVVAHLALHWRWLVKMTRRQLSRRPEEATRRRKDSEPRLQAERSTSETPVHRRRR